MAILENLTVTVTYTVGLGNVEVTQEMIDKIKNLSSDTLSTNSILSEDESDVMEFLSSTIKERDAYEWEYEILDAE